MKSRAAPPPRAPRRMTTETSTAPHRADGMEHNMSTEATTTAPQFVLNVNGQEHGFDEGLRATVRWYLANPSWCAHVRSGEYRQWLEKNYERR